MSEVPKRPPFVFVLLVLISGFIVQGCSIRHISQRVDPPYPPELGLQTCQMSMINAVGQGVSSGCTTGKNKPVIVAVNQPSSTDIQKQALRNQYIDQSVISINTSYRAFKDSYYVGQASFDTLSDFTLLTLTGLTAIVGDAGVKAALGAASAGVTGAHSSVQKNFFENNARDAIFAIMDSLRQGQLAKIDQSKQLSTEQYSMSEALRDLDLYYEMGTVLKAQEAVYAGANSAQPSSGTKQTTVPTISTQPSGQTITQGQTATLSVAATGAAPLTYQWYQGASGDTGNAIAGATNSSFTTPALVTSASYWVRVTNASGHADSGAAAVAVNQTGAPTIVTQPGNQVIATGQTATLSVTAVGAAPLTYQWYQGASGDTGNPIAGAANSTFTTPAMTTGANYWVRVTNASGHSDSATASVTVTADRSGPPAISTQPSGQTITQGQTATLSVAATGAAPLTYQWYQGASGDTGNAIAGATNSSFTTPALVTSASDLGKSDQRFGTC